VARQKNIQIGVLNSCRSSDKNRFKGKLLDTLSEIKLQTEEILRSVIRSKNDGNSPKDLVLPYQRNVEREGILL